MSLLVVALEAMDKEPHLSTVWPVALVIAIAGYLLARLRFWLVVRALIIWAVAAWAALGDLLDPIGRPAMPAERQTMIDCTHTLPNHSPVASRYLPRLRLYRETGPLLVRDRSMATALRRESRSPLGR